MLRCRLPWRWISLVLGCVVAVGCTDSGRRGITGTVTFDGAPLESGTINFVPLPGTASPTAGAPIENGEFEVPSEGGTLAGRFQVVITASRRTGRTMSDPRGGEPIDVKVQFIPHRYNQASELEVEVSDEDENVFEFALVSE